MKNKFIQQYKQGSYVCIRTKLKGFTLIELIITIAISGILMSLALPSFEKTMQNTKLTSMHNELVSSLNLARNIAISRGSFATVCKINQAGDNCDTSASWKDGWIVFQDGNSNGSIDNGELVTSMNNTLPKNISIIFQRNRVTYGAQGYASGFNGTFTFCDDLDNNNKTGIIISNTGSIRIAESDTELNECSN